MTPKGMRLNGEEVMEDQTQISQEALHMLTVTHKYVLYIFILNLKLLASVVKQH